MRTHDHIFVVYRFLGVLKWGFLFKEIKGPALSSTGG
jgi:hypothetical protein